MRIFRVLLHVLLWMLAAAILAVAVSSIAERGEGETLLSFIGFRFSITGVGGAASFLVIVLFAELWMADSRKRNGEAALSSGNRLNAVGFGLLPGAAAWKVFEHTTTLGRGKPVFEPLPEIPFLTADHCFLPSRIEMVLSLLCFLAFVGWLILRKDDLPGNGDLLLAVLCVWGMIRTWTEGLRTEPFLRAGNVNITQILFSAAALIPMGVWASRLEKAKKSTVFTALEWIAVLGCVCIMILNSSGVFSAGSGIGDFSINAGCAVLSILLILLTGKDSRTA